MGDAEQSERLERGGRPTTTYITLAVLFVVLFGTLLVAIAMYYDGQNKQKHYRKDSDLACVFYNWTEWSECDRTCKSGDAPGLKYRYINNGSQKGLDISKCSLEGFQSLECNDSPCPENVSSLKWTKWTNLIKINEKKPREFKFRNIIDGKVVTKNTEDIVRCRNEGEHTEEKKCDL